MKTQPQIESFAADVARGLTGTPKSLSSKYFYDDRGSQLFQEIMRLPEYYLTRAEFEIFSTQTKEIFTSFTENANSFDLIELGAGDGTKTAVLIDYFLDRNADFTYAPIDISQEAIAELTEKFKREFPALSINARTGDYFRTLESLRTDGARPKIILFLGSNIGNFSREQAIDFFRKLRGAMNDDDLLFVGFDLQKDPRTILRAYDDAQGVTAQFNLNLLARINRELGADFDLNEFSHYAIYNPADGAARSFLVSRKRQTVRVEALNKIFDFKAWEAIYMEISQKYTVEMIEDLARASGFQVRRNFYDAQNLFVDSLWKTV